MPQLKKSDIIWIYTSLGLFAVGVFASVGMLLFHRPDEDTQVQMTSDEEKKSIGEFVSTQAPEGYDELIKVPSPFVETDYPAWFAPGYESDDLDDWLPLLDTADQQKKWYLVVPKFGAIAPIATDITITNDPTLDIDHFATQLQNGLMHHPGTQNPGVKGGNFVVAGHTSSPKLQPGRYKTIFQFLPLLRDDDVIWVYHISDDGVTRWVYHVFTSQETQATNTSILSQPAGNASILTLYGCYPFGTLTNRWYVQSSLISKEFTPTIYQSRQTDIKPKG